jgi:hypothetical protein
MRQGIDALKHGVSTIATTSSGKFVRDDDAVKLQRSESHRFPTGLYSRFGAPV